MHWRHAYYTTRMNTASHDTAPIRRIIPADGVQQSIAELVAGIVGVDAARRLLERGGVWLDGRRVGDATAAAPPGGRLTIHRPPDGAYAELDITPADIIYEDAWLLALNKRAGWYTGPTPWDAQGNVLAALTQWLANRDGAAPTLHLAHQLDRDTSGILLTSKDPAANAPLQAAFAGGAVNKTYLGVCAGVPEEERYEIRTGHGRSRGGRWRVYPLDQIGAPLLGGSRVKFAHTGIEVVQRLDEATLIRATLHTGRTHQIRLHLASIGHPLLGDRRYGGPSPFPDAYDGHLLHASHLRLPHPITGQLLELVADPPPRITETLHRLRLT